MTATEEIEEIIRTKANNKLEEILQAAPEVANGVTSQGTSYLLYAAYCRNREAINMLRKRTLPIDIYEAAAIGELAIVKDLVENKNVMVNSFSTDGFTPLGLSCFFKNIDIAKYLIENGADVNLPSKNEFKVAPLHSACAISNVELATLLLKHGAQVNAKQIGGVTALHEAAHNGETELAQLLINHKADVNAKMDNGNTPLFMAEERACIDTADLIRVYGGR